jgi:carboxyl-terminal processing protease
MKRRLAYGLVALVLGVNLVIGARVYSSSAATGERESAYPSLELFSVMERVRKEYVDGKDLSYRELVQSALKGMLNELDPHSEFMDASSTKNFRTTHRVLLGVWASSSRCETASSRL